MDSQNPTPPEQPQPKAPPRKYKAKATPTEKSQRPANPKGGRPKASASRPTPEQLSMIENYSRIRLSTNEIAALCDISTDTFERWMKKYPEVKAAVMKARTNGKAHAVRSAYMRAFPVPEFVYDDDGKLLKDKHGNPIKKLPKGDTVMAIFLLKTLYGFKEPDKKLRIEGNKGDTEIVFNIAGKHKDTKEISEELMNYYDKKE